jgi:hypothetical protein
METETTQNRLAVREQVVAAETGLSLALLRKDRREGRRIPYFKIGSAVRYNLDRVREALAALEVGGPAPRPGRRRT